ncbi:hypothetical protein [Priestia megaterium]|uniref:Transposase n=1 Tax=Priestia megaterium TaxID=1404 RepID=A0A6M6E741_PRIMG|nr:hypothetical protein [Priestia megaterium]QJX80368.1 hypothetical protein FDZ14_30235 [Priestia megaterium]
MEEGLKKYIECMEYIQLHSEYKDRYGAYLKNVTDEANRLYTAREEGKQEAEQKIVKNCLNYGLTVEQIEEMVGFDPRPYID